MTPPVVAQPAPTPAPAPPAHDMDADAGEPGPEPTPEPAPAPVPVVCWLPNGTVATCEYESNYGLIRWSVDHLDYGCQVVRQGEPYAPCVEGNPCRVHSQYGAVITGRCGH